MTTGLVVGNRPALTAPSSTLRQSYTRDVTLTLMGPAGLGGIRKTTAAMATPLPYGGPCPVPPSTPQESQSHGPIAATTILPDPYWHTDRQHRSQHPHYAQPRARNLKDEGDNQVRNPMSKSHIDLGHSNPNGEVPSIFGIIMNNSSARRIPFRPFNPRESNRKHASPIAVNSAVLLVFSAAPNQL